MSSKRPMGVQYQFLDQQLQSKKSMHGLKRKTGTHVNGPTMECQTSDWPSSTPTPILNWRDNQTADLHATGEVLLIGYGSHACVKFRQTYLTYSIRDDCFAEEGYARNVQEACLTILDTLREVLTKSEIQISLIELMRVGPKFIIIDMVTSALYEDVQQDDRSAKMDAWVRGACDASQERTERLYGEQ